MSTESKASYPVEAVNKVKRRQDRGFYEHATVHAVLDAATGRTDLPHRHAP
jgi:hypothetical protein